MQTLKNKSSCCFDSEKECQNIKCLYKVEVYKMESLYIYKYCVRKFKVNNFSFSRILQIWFLKKVKKK